MDDIYYVQVRDKETGEEYPVPLDRYQANKSLFERLDGETPTHPETGAVLPVKPRTSVAREATKRKSGQSAVNTKKENN